MDPLSIIASTIALAGAASKISTAISRLRHFGEVPGKIYALKNEISDLEVVLRQIGCALDQNLLASDSAHGSLEQILGRTKERLAKLAIALERIANICTQTKIQIISKSTIWYKEKAVFQGFRNDIVQCKASLNLILAATNSQHLKHIILELRKVTVETAHAGQSNARLDRGLDNNHLALSTRIDQQHEALRDRIDALGRTLSNPQLQGTDAERLHQITMISKEKGDTVRVVTSHRVPCRTWCPCVCHTKRKLRLASPGMMDSVLGRMFIGYSGMPLQKETCNFRGCDDRQNVTATVEYWFPSWLLSRNLRFYLTYQPRAGPDFQLSTTRRVPDSAQSITFAMQGNIDGLKHLFNQGLAGPRDVSDSRGYTLLRWALYGGMHNHETVQFLIREGALVDDESYTNVWDFVFRGKCSEKQQEALRCITEGGDGDWVEEQNFPLVHRIIFGLSTKSLASELDENPRAIYLTDTQNRTALDWATARSQLEDMTLLIQHGAETNNMDVTGRTPVLHAVDTHNAETLHLILKAKGNPNPTYPKGLFRSSPLTAAGFAGMPILLKLLLDFEADPNACNPEGLTALHSVARTHNIECAQLLLEYGADVNATSARGQTPLMVAIIHNNHPVLRLFLQLGYEYMTTPRFAGPDILPIVAEHADVETMHILSAAQPLRVSFDIGWSSIKSNRELLEKRRDYDEKLGDAYGNLLAIAKAEADEVKSVDSMLECGLFISARSSFHSEIAEAMSQLDLLNITPTESDGSDEWEDTRDTLSPISDLRSKPRSPTSPRQHFRFPPSTREIWHTNGTASPLRQEMSR